MSIARMIEKLSEIREAAILYPPPSGSAKPIVRTTLSAISQPLDRYTAN